jgi:DNA-binding CsgD family transcriptional regulator
MLEMDSLGRWSEFDVQCGSIAGPEFVEMLIDPPAVLRRLEQLGCAATSVQCILTGRGWRPPVLELLATAGEQRRLLIDASLATEPLVLEKAARQLDVRVHGGALRHLFAFDDRYAVLPIDQTDLGTGALLLRTPFATPYTQLFELLWAEAQPISHDAPHYDGLTARELEVVHLLVRGATDHQVAHRLGVSSRTVRNVVSELHRRFGTTSRMALGFQLAHRRRCEPDSAETRAGRGW